MDRLRLPSIAAPPPPRIPSASPVQHPDYLGLRGGQGTSPTGTPDYLGLRGGLGRQGQQPGGERDPFGGLLANSTWRDNFEDPFASYFNQSHQGFGLPGSGEVGQVGSMPGFGQFRPEDDADIQRAAQEFGVPANFLKAIVARESSGNWSGNSNWVNSVRGGARIYGYVGVFENAAREWGFDFDSLNGDRLGQLRMLATGLRRFYDRAQQANPAYGWENVASMHFSGRWEPTGWADELGNVDTEYLQTTMDWWRQLDQYAGQNTQGFAPGGGGGDIYSAMLGGQSDYRITQEMGLTDFAQGAGAWMYGYASAYGVQGHAGVDIGLVPGTPVYTPVGGTVVHSGGTGYYTDERYGNSPGTGEFRVRLDNGDELILGHMQSINAQVGQRVNAGSQIGLSGTYNGGHVHVEYRQLTPGATSSGFTAIDPQQALGGGMGGMMGGGGGGGPMAGMEPSTSFGHSLIRFMHDSSYRSALESTLAR